MTIPLASLVQGKEMAQAVVAALVAGIGITLVFSLGIWGAARFADLSRDERRLAATATAVLSGLAFAATVGAVVVGIVVMTNK